MPDGAVEESKVRKLPTPSHYRSPTLSQTLRCRGHRPTTASRCSRVRLVDRPRQCVCKHLSDRIPNVSKLPVPSRHRALTPSQTARASRLSPITVSRWSKICLIDRPRQLVCKHRHDRIPNVSKLPAPSRHRALTPSQTARASRRSPISVSRWSKMCPIVQRRQLVCKRPCDWIPKVGKLPLAVSPSP